MKRIPFVNENACNHLISGIRYMADQPTNFWVPFLHGVGEVGPLDGSMQHKIETHGYPKHIKNGLSLPFNVYAVQSPVQNHNAICKVLVPHLMMQYGAEDIVVTGLSMGGYGTWNMLWRDHYKKLKAIVPVCGASNFSNYQDANNIPVLAVHGDKDTKVYYSRGKKTVDLLNEAHPGQAELITLPGVGHNAWDQAYDVNHPVGQRVLDFIMTNLHSGQNEYERGYEAFRSKALQIIGML